MKWTKEIRRQFVQRETNSRLYSARKLGLILSSVGTGKQTLAYCWQEFKLVRFFVVVGKFLSSYQNNNNKKLHVLFDRSHSSATASSSRFSVRTMQQCLHSDHRRIVQQKEAINNLRVHRGGYVNYLIRMRRSRVCRC